MEIDNKYKWNLKDIFEDEKELEMTKLKVSEILDKMVTLKGTLAKSSNNIYECYSLYEVLLENFEKIFSYAMLKYNQDMSVTKSIEDFKYAENMSSDINTKLSFIVPEITKIDEPILRMFLQEGNMKKYSRIIEDIIKNKKHILSEEVEKTLASYTEVFGATENIYDVLTDVEFKFPKIEDENGLEVEVTQGTYTNFLKSSNRKVRIAAFESMYFVYKSYINTISELYLTNVKTDTITSRLRGYKSSLDKAVDNDDSTIKVYDNIVKVVNENLNINHRYMKLKKRLLNLDEMHIYDIYVNPIGVNDTKVEYEKTKEIVIEALAPMGNEYIDTLKIAFKDNWIDVYETPNKKGGAYSMGVYNKHPFILANYTNTLRDTSTIAHELGHSMHSYYSSSNQSVIDSNYTIMVAEVASTVNEILLGEYLIKKEQDKTKKIELILEQLENIRSTLIRQTMFAEFEKIVHEKVENSENLSQEKLCDIYYELNKKYYGENVIIDENIKYEWARIPHFYSSFYVYKYSTGICAAIAIASKILAKEDGFVEKYIDMLKQGCTKKSIDLLKMVDVDLESKKPYEDAFKVYEKYINELEELIN